MMQKIIDYFKQYIGVISIVLAVCILLTYSLSYFMVNTGNKRAAEMYIGELKYSIEIDGTTTNTLTIPTGETIIDVKVNNLNPVDTYFKLLYLKNDNVTISYYDKTKNTSETYTKYLSSGDIIDKNITGTLKLKIINNSSSAQTLTFSVSGGYSTNKLTDVDVPSTYSEITTMETTSSNTYFCETNTSDALSQGLNYVDGQYTYSYMQEGSYGTTKLGWINIDANGWGVQLSNKASTDAVTSNVCTYINNKPIVSMVRMFFSSAASTINLNINTSNVTNMNLMFGNTKITELDLSNFDTSKVTNMTKMFSGCAANELDLSGFNTSNVKSMDWMFYNSKATAINLSGFNTSNVTTMADMFACSKVTTLDLSNFNTSNVTSMSEMFLEAIVTTIDLNSFDTSKVVTMAGMFTDSSITDVKGIEKFNTSNVTDLSSMFWRTKFVTLDLSSFDTSKVTRMVEMFMNSENLKAIYVSDKFVTNSVKQDTNMFFGCTNLVGGNGTKYNSSHVDKTYARIDGGTSNPGYFTDVADKDVPAPNSFTTDSWKTIIKAVKNNNISKYNVGDTRTIDMGTYGTHTLRIANISTPSECKTEGFSQSACGFVLEFADIITTHNMNPSGTYKGTQYNNGWNVDGWPASEMYTFVNNDIYNSLPSEIKNAIIDTTVVSEYGKSDTENFTSTDKLYLLAPKEIYTDWSRSWDSAKDLTRTLDYYTNIRVTTSSYSGAIKYKGTSADNWWLRAANYINTINFLYVYFDGNCYTNTARTTYGVAPAFRIG